jgi:hypothetical protein
MTIASKLARVIIVVIAVILAGSSPSPVKKVDCPVYYDGEGNEIPDYAVRLLVRSEFVLMLPTEIDTIQRYFYLKGHMCPFRLCPMKGERYFSGCHDCDIGSDCYVLDSIHWKHPTFSYDECDSIFTK